jgi:DNA-binding MarR family transcriptional regulator
LLERQRRRDDEREVEITLTQTGQDLHERATSVPRCMADRLCLTVDEFKKLRDDLKSLAAQLAAPTDPRD